MDKETLLEENFVVRWTKTELFGHEEQQCVWGIEDEAFHPKNTIPTDKHGDESIMLWAVLLGIMRDTLLDLWQTYLVTSAMCICLSWTQSSSSSSSNTSLSFAFPIPVVW